MPEDKKKSPYCGVPSKLRRLSIFYSVIEEINALLSNSFEIKALTFSVISRGCLECHGALGDVLLPPSKLLHLNDVNIELELWQPLDFHRNPIRALDFVSVFILLTAFGVVLFFVCVWWKKTHKNSCLQVWIRSLGKCQSECGSAAGRACYD